MSGNGSLVETRGLVKTFPVETAESRGRKMKVKAVDGVDLEISVGETFGLVGESGSGKSTLAQCITGLLESDGGQILFHGSDITKQSKRARELRQKMGIVFQDPYMSLDPRQTVVNALIEPVLYNKKVKTKDEAVSRAEKIIERVGLNEDHLYRYPHEFSGGQRQRIAVARTLMMEPEFVILDEPTSFLDMSVQAQVLNLLKELQGEFHLTYMFISHNLSVIEHMTDRIAIMYLGKIVEVGPRESIFRSPSHPYTNSLISSLPIPDPFRRKEHRLLRGEVPSPVDVPSGCRVRTRCPYAADKCATEEPLLLSRSPGHQVACHFDLKLASPLAVSG